MTWPRVSVAIVALWLLASPWALPVPAVPEAGVVSTVAALAILAVVAGSARQPMLRPLLLLIALALIAWGWGRFPRPGPAVAQNAILVGLVLGLLGVVPDEAFDPPPGWRPHVREEG